MPSAETIQATIAQHLPQQLLCQLSCDLDRLNYFQLNRPNGDPRWVFPKEARLGLSVLKQWQPYGSKSQLLWKILLLLYRLNLLHCLKKNTPYFQDFKSNGSLVPVCYIGTEGAEQKLVLFLLDETTLRTEAVVKLPMRPKALEQIQRENHWLKTLEEKQIHGVPTLLFESPSAVVQRYQALTPSQSNISKQHVDFLNQLHQATQHPSQAVSAIIDTLCATSNNSLILETLNSISKHSNFLGPPTVASHGDFAPWNMGWTEKKELFVFDWEAAQDNGFIGEDLCHFFFSIKRFLTPSLNVLEKAHSIQDYWKKNQLSQQSINGVYQLYLAKQWHIKNEYPSENKETLSLIQSELKAMLCLKF